MGKRRVIAETGAGQHGVATATAAALLDLECVVYMGEVDTERQALNVARMRMLGAEVDPGDHRQRAPSRTPSTRPCATGSPTSSNTHYLLGTAAGPHPFPAMVRDFHRVIGVEARAQVLDLTGRLPDAVDRLRRRRLQRDRHLPRFLDDADVRLSASRPAATASRPAGTRPDSPAAQPGVLHGTRTYLLQDDDGQTLESHSISAGLDYPASARSTPGCTTPAGPSTATPPTTRRWTRSSCSAAPRASSRRSSARTRWPARWRSARELGPDALIVVNLSGRGDKDVHTAGAIRHPRRATVERHGRRAGDERRQASCEHRGRRRPQAAAPRRPRRAGRLPARRLPDVEGCIDAMVAMVEAGRRRHRGRLPYCDPVMDGPVIQNAGDIALAARRPRRRRLHGDRGGRATPAPRRW